MSFHAGSASELLPEGMGPASEPLLVFGLNKGHSQAMDFQCHPWLWTEAGNDVKFSV
jgi:hypothetical protein